MIIFDCDNTLWRGVAGESKVEELEFDGNTPVGKIFNEVHYIVKSLLKKGVMISICSKNNLTDVKKVFKSDKTILNINEFTSFRINWKNKFENIVDLSKELNIGLNSIIFIDDNSFEINSVKKKLPEVLSFKVPDNLYEYPKFLRKIENLYFSQFLTSEDLIRNKSYEINKVRKSLENKSQNLEKFINSLKIKINIEKNKYAHLDRIVQMCQRTNQFNFTSKRYFHKDIQRILRDKNYHVFTFDIQDKFGSYGITALLISKTNKSKKQVYLDSFLMSCRVLGKNIHLSIFDFIVKHYKKIGYKNLLVNYIPTQKNILLKQVLNELDFHENNEKNNYTYNIDIERFVKKSKNNFIIRYNG
jgi:FkbH-like protein